MKKITSHRREVRRLCERINREADHERLQDLCGRLQQALRQEQSPTLYRRSPQIGRHDNPFDKVLVC